MGNDGSFNMMDPSTQLCCNNQLYNAKPFHRCCGWVTCIFIWILRYRFTMFKVWSNFIREMYNFRL